MGGALKMRLDEKSGMPGFGGDVGLRELERFPTKGGLSAADPHAFKAAPAASSRSLAPLS